MTDVYEWPWGETPTRHQCEAVGNPERNSTGRTTTEAREVFVGGWNDHYGGSLTVDDFNFVPGPPPTPE